MGSARLIGALTCTLVGAFVSTTTASFAATGGFVSTNGAWDIQIMAADGTQRYQLTGTNLNEQYPAWSQDGSQIAFMRGPATSCPMEDSLTAFAPVCDSSGGIYVMTSNGGDTHLLRRFSEGRELRSPTWSPDGAKLAFVHEGSLFVVSADGSGLRALTQGFSDENPEWAPDGSALAFDRTAQGETRREIYLIAPDGTDLRKVTSTDSIDRAPSWAPNGNKLAFSSFRPFLVGGVQLVGVQAIYTIGTNGTGLTRLTGSDGLSASQPTWSPDGSEIAFVRSHSLLVMNALDGDQSGTRTVYDGFGGEQPLSPDWRACPSACSETLPAEDSTAPTPPSVETTGRFFQPQLHTKVSWHSTDAGRGVADYFIYREQIRWDGGARHEYPWFWNAISPFRLAEGRQGFTYCYWGYAEDNPGNDSAWGQKDCYAVPLDDRQLSAGGGTWSRRRAAGYFRNTVTRAESDGATLVRSGIVAKRLSLIATRCPACGGVDVFWRGTLLRRISLRSDARQTKHVIPLALFASRQSGKLVLRARTSGGTVLIDGLGVGYR